MGCATGTDCADCGPRGAACVYPPPTPLPPPSPPIPTGCLCIDDCNYASDADCDDGGPGAEYAICAIGRDCTDCGMRWCATQPGPAPSIAAVATPPPPAALITRAPMLGRLQLAAGHVLERVLRCSRSMLQAWLCQLASRVRLGLRRMQRRPLLHHAGNGFSRTASYVRTAAAAAVATAAVYCCAEEQHLRGD